MLLLLTNEIQRNESRWNPWTDRKFSIFYLLQISLQQQYNRIHTDGIRKHVTFELLVSTFSLQGCVFTCKSALCHIFNFIAKKVLVSSLVGWVNYRKSTVFILTSCNSLQRIERESFDRRNPIRAKLPHRPIRIVSVRFRPLL